MAKATKHWKRGRGKLGIIAPLIGNWKATASTPMGPVTCKKGWKRFTEHHYKRI